MLRVYARALGDLYARGARARGVAGGQTGMVTALQRAGGALNTNVHFHTLVLDGVFTAAPGGALAFHPAPGPSDAEVAAALATIRHRVQRLLVRHGLEPGDDATGPADGLADESPVLAGIVGASVQGVALGSRAGLERLCRYVLRPPFAQERLRRRSDGRVALELKRAWHDGTRELVFEPLEFLERLAAMMPRPETHLLICHGVLVPGARWRERVVAYGRVEPGPTMPPLVAGPDGPGVKSSPRAGSWAALMHRAFAIDVLACPHCGGRLRLIATLHDPVVIRKLLAHLGLARSGPSPGPAPPSPAPPGPDRLLGARRTTVVPARRGNLSPDPAGPRAG